MMIKGVIFDFGFTLFYFDNPSLERYYDFFKKGLLKSIDLLREIQVLDDNFTIESFLEIFKKKREHFFRKSIKTKTEFQTSLIFQKVLESLEKDKEINSLEKMSEEIYKELADKYHSCEEEEWIPFSNTKDTLEKIIIKKVKVGLISNHPNHKTIKNVLIKHDLEKFFDVIVTSAKFGKRKPDPNIFFHTLEKMGLKNQDNSIIMCGDEYADIAGAQRANLQAVLYERKYKFPFEKEIEDLNLRKIVNISDILDFII